MRRNVFIVGILLIALVGLSILTKKDSPATPVPKPSPAVIDKDATDAKVVTLQFYQAYDTCVKQPPEEVTEDISSYCQENNTFVATNFNNGEESNTTQVTLGDPILCSQDIPTGYQVTDAKTEDQDMKVTLHALFGSSSEEIVVNVIKEENRWKVSDVTCTAS